MGKHSYPKRKIQIPINPGGRAKLALAMSGAVVSPFIIAATGVSLGVYVADKEQARQLGVMQASNSQQDAQDPANATQNASSQLAAGTAREAQERSWADYDGSELYYENRIQTFDEMSEEEIATALALGSGGDPALRGEKNGGLSFKSPETQGGTDTQVPGVFNPQTNVTEPQPSPSTATPNLWDGVAECESSGNWQINTGNGYYGGLQFSKSTWDLYGGEEFADYPHEATKEEQIIVAERVLAGFEGIPPQGIGAWPTCGQYLISNPAPASSGVSGPECPLGPGSNYGFSVNADFVYRALCHYFPQVQNYGGYRAGDPQDHGTGHAVDAMVHGDWATGDGILEFLLNHREELGVKYIIWKQTIYGDWNGWSAEVMEDRGSTTQNHYDHVHVSVY